MAKFQTKNRIKYFILIFVLVLLTILSLALNYVYVLVYERNLYVNNLTQTTQGLINNRTYIVSALQALETIIDNNSNNANFVQILKIKEKLPQVFLNSDYSITPSIEQRFNKLKSDLDDYIKSTTKDRDNNKNKDFMLLNLTALRSELSAKLELNRLKYKDLVASMNVIATNLELLVKFAAGLFIAIILCFYYLLNCLTKEYKFKLKDFTELDNPIKNNNISNLIEIEHLCQRLNYCNSSLLKKVSNNDLIIQALIKKQNNAIGIAQNISIKNNITFGLLAELMEIHNNIVDSLSDIAKENNLIAEDINNNAQYTAKIFGIIQVMNAPILESEMV